MNFLSLIITAVIVSCTSHTIIAGVIKMAEAPEFPERDFNYLEPDNDIDETETQSILRGDSVTAWPNAEIYYRVKKKDFNASQMAFIERAMCLIEQSTCVRFLPKAKDTEYYVSVESGTSCSTKIGRQPTTGAQIVNLDKNVCFTRVGQISHEFFHALGFYHEIQRNDRDDYVVVNYDNLERESSARQFNIKDPIAANYAGPFDFESIMLYNRYEFAKKGKTSFDPTVQVPHGVHIGQRTKLSDGDISKVKRFYECKYITPKPITHCEEEGRK